MNNDSLRLVADLLEDLNIKQLSKKDSLRLVEDLVEDLNTKPLPKKELLRLVEDLVEDLNTKPLPKTDLESDESKNSRNIINSNSKLSQGFGWVGNDQKATEISPDSSGCDCPYCCGDIVPDLESTNTSNNFLDINTSLFDAASSDVTDVDFKGENNIDSLMYPAKWASNRITYSFFDGGDYYGSENVTRVEEEGQVFKQKYEKIKDYLRDILENKIESFLNVDFVEVDDTGNDYGQIRYMFSDGPSTAYTKVPHKYRDSPKAGDIHLNPDKINDFAAGPGAYRYETLIHETFHALNLKHPGNYNGSSNGNQSGEFLPYGEDNSTNTVMSYNRLRYTSGYSGVITGMSYDMRALQYMYGANNEYYADNTLYEFENIDDYQIGNKKFGNPDYNSKQTVWDAGGEDTFDVSQLQFKASGYRIDLRPGGVITSKDDYEATTYEARGDNSGKKYDATSRGTFLAYNVTIENLINSSSDDRIFANDGANNFGGYGRGKETGNDKIIGADGEDVLDLSSYANSDLTIANNGYDLVYYLDNNGSVTIEDYYKAAQSDRIQILTADSNPDPTLIDGALVWEAQGLADESAVATGSEFILDNGVTVTVNWEIVGDRSKFTPYAGDDYVSYDSGKQGNHTGYLSLGFDHSENNSNDLPDDLIKLSLDFNQPVTGLNLTLLDVDQGKIFDSTISKAKVNDDGVEIYADGINIKNLSGVVEIVTGNKVKADNESYMNGFEGIGNSGAGKSSEGGNISLDFGSTEVSSLEIKYFSTDDAIPDPTGQKIGISDLLFQTQST